MTHGIVAKLADNLKNDLADKLNKLEKVTPLSHAGSQTVLELQ